MAEPSSNIGAAKKLFSIPSIDDISKYEAQRPKIPSNFKSLKNQQTSSVGNSDLKLGSSRNSTSQGKTTITTTSSPTLDSQQKSAHGPVRKAVVSNSDQQGKTVANLESSSSSPSSSAIVSDQSNANHGIKDVQLATSTSSEGQTSSSMPTTSSGDSQNARPLHQSGGSRIQFTSAADFVKKRGKIGSGFAEKFKMLGKADEYKEPQASGSQPIAGTSVAGQQSMAGASTKAASGNSVIVNPRQRGNPILKHIRNVPWEFGDIVPDYVMGRTTCALYLSLRYHHLNPNYIHDRLKELGHKFDMRVLLVQVDVKVPHHSVKELARMAILADCTLILAWSAEEAGRYLETYKAYENKPADALKVKVEQDHASRMTDCLTGVKSVNKTDVITLLANYGTFDKIVGASKEELALLPGFGPQKAQRLNNIFTEPFLRKNKRRKIQDSGVEDAT